MVSLTMMGGQGRSPTHSWLRSWPNSRLCCCCCSSSALGAFNICLLNIRISGRARGRRRFTGSFLNSSDDNKHQSSLIEGGIAKSSFAFAKWQLTTNGLAAIFSCMFWLGIQPQICPYSGESGTPVWHNVSLDPTSGPPKWHLNPSNS